MQREKTHYCYHCQTPLQRLDEYIVVKKAIHPKRVPHRWVRIGRACMACGLNKPCHLEYVK